MLQSEPPLACCYKPSDILIRSKHTALLYKKNFNNKTAGVDCILHYMSNDNLRNTVGCLPLRLTQ